MALSYFVGSFTKKTSTGSQAVTGVGFQPKAVIFFHAADQTADGSNTSSAMHGLGFAVSSTNRAAIFSNALAEIRQSGSACIELLDSGSTILGEADLTSLDSDGFTLNWSTANGTAYVINYIALGGADLTNAFVKQVQAPSTTGNVAYTGVGFKPTCILSMTACNVTTPPATDAVTSGMGFGAAVSSTARAASVSGIGATWARLQETTVFAASVATTSSIRTAADLVSLDSDGFTVNWTNTASNSQDYHWFLCIAGGKCAVGSISQPTSTGSQATSGLSFQPTGLALFSFNAVAGTSVIADYYFSFGSGSSSTARANTWSASISPGTSTAANLDRTKIIKCLTPATPTVNSAADLTSLDSAGFTLNWTTTDTTARQILYVALGSSGSIVTTKTQTAISRITASATKTQASVSRVQSAATKTQTSVSRLQKSTSQTEPAVARVTAKATKTEPAVGRITASAVKTQAAVSRVTSSTTKTQPSTSRVTTSATKTEPGVSRVTASATKTQPGTGRLQTTSTQTAPAVGRIQKFSAQTQVSQSRVTAATIKSQSAVGNVQGTTARTQAGVANIIGPDTKEQHAQARIQATTVWTQAAAGRIQRTGTVAQTAVSRIGEISLQTQSAQARVSGTTARAQAAIANVQATSTRSVRAVARVSGASIRTQSGTSRVRQSATKNQSAFSRVQIQAVRAQSAIADILGTASKFQSGVSRISSTALRNQSARANIAPAVQIRLVHMSESVAPIQGHGILQMISGIDQMKVDLVQP